MNGLAARLAAYFIQPLRQSMWRSGRVMLLVLMSIGFLVIAVGFAAAAVSSWLAAVYGPTVAAFVLAA